MNPIVMDWSTVMVVGLAACCGGALVQEVASFVRSRRRRAKP
jgi:hypothetical protein